MYPQLIIGDSYSFTTSVPDYPATDGWTLAHLLRPRSSGDLITLTAAASGDDYVTTVTAATSGGWDAGEYSVVAQVSNVGGERHTLDAVALSNGRLTSNLVTILANPSEGDAIDSRSYARRMLDTLRTTYEESAAQAQERFTIYDREVWLRKLEEIQKQIEYWQGIVNSEEAGARIASGLPDPCRKYVRFRRV